LRLKDLLPLKDLFCNKKVKLSVTLPEIKVNLALLGLQSYKNDFYTERVMALA